LQIFIRGVTANPIALLADYTLPLCYFFGGITSTLVTQNASASGISTTALSNPRFRQTLA